MSICYSLGSKYIFPWLQCLQLNPSCKKNAERYTGLKIKLMFLLHAPSFLTQSCLLPTKILNLVWLAKLVLYLHKQVSNNLKDKSLTSTEISVKIGQSPSLLKTTVVRKDKSTV